MTTNIEKCDGCGITGEPLYEDDLGKLYCSLCADEKGMFDLDNGKEEPDYTDLQELTDEEARYEAKGGK